MKTELAELREEVTALRREIAELRADRAVHHYHHAPSPLESQGWPYYIGSPNLLPQRPPAPYYPQYVPATCGGNSSELNRCAGSNQP